MALYKYSQAYYNAAAAWEELAVGSTEILKGKLHHPYIATKKFDPSPLSLISLKNRGLKSLYFGCGIGRNLPYLKKISASVDGFDLPAMIEKCKRETNRFNHLYTDWSECCNQEYNLALDVFSMQGIPDVAAVSQFLKDISKISDYFYLVTRNYIDDKHHTNILKLIGELDIFYPVAQTCDLKAFTTLTYPAVDFAEFLFISKYKNRLKDLRDANTFSALIGVAQKEIDCGFQVRPILTTGDDPKYLYDDEHTDIAFIHKDTSNTISGSTYYNRVLIHLLVSLGYHVKTYSHMTDVNLVGRNFYQFRGNAISNSVISDLKGNLDNMDIINTSCYFCTPGTEALSAIKMAAKYNKPLYLILYDCPLWYNDPELYKHMSNIDEVRYRDEYYIGIDLADKHNTLLKEHLHKYYANIPQLTMITLTENSIPYWAEFFGLDQSCFIAIQPCINNRVKDHISVKKRKKQIVCINRNSWNKGLDQVLKFFKDFANEYMLHIVTNSLEGLEWYTYKHEVNINRVVIHTNISDAEKFILLQESELLISASVFEGFGMWAIEALSCGTPVVCYDLKSLENIQHDHLYKVERFNADKFHTKMHEVLADKPVFVGTTEYDFDKAIDDIRDKISIPINDITAFTPNSGGSYHISTVFQTTPAVFHFNSIYNRSTCIHLDSTWECWNQILTTIQNNRGYSNVPDALTVFTFSNKPLPTILEVACELQGIKLVKLGSDIKQWHHNDRLKYVIEFLSSINSEYVLHVDALDAVIYGDLNNLLDYGSKNMVLFNAEEVCHPENKDIIKAQSTRTQNTVFKFLNGGVFFGKRLKVMDVCRIAQLYPKYIATTPMCDDCDQGKLNQVYINYPELVEIDNICQFFYCNDYKTDASKWLRISQYDNT